MEKGKYALATFPVRNSARWQRRERGALKCGRKDGDGEVNKEKRRRWAAFGRRGRVIVVRDKGPSRDMVLLAWPLHKSVNFDELFECRRTDRSVRETAAHRQSTLGQLIGLSR